MQAAAVQHSEPNAAELAANGSLPPQLPAIRRSMIKPQSRPLNAGDFKAAVRRAAEHTGCEVLLELPGALFARPQGHAAAICRGAAHADPEFVFFIMQPEGTEIALVLGKEAPELALTFTRSYAGVLGLLAADAGVAKLQ